LGGRLELEWRRLVAELRGVRRRGGVGAGVGGKEGRGALETVRADLQRIRESATLMEEKVAWLEHEFFDGQM
jgi:hypothetical protein